MHKKLNICFATREFDHERFGNTGGIGVFIKNLAKELSEKGHKVYIFGYGGKRQSFIFEDIQVKKIRDIYFYFNKIQKRLDKIPFPLKNKIPYLFHFIGRFYFAINLSIFVIRKQIDIVEFNDFFGDGAFFPKITKVLIRCHGSSTALSNYMGYKKNEFIQFFEKIAFRRITNVVCVSNYCSDITTRSFNLKNSPTVIYNGIDVNEKYCTSYFNNNVIPKSIFYFGTLREEKGLGIACNVVNELIKHYPDLTFHLIGYNESNNWENIVLKTLSKEAKKQTHYYGKIPNEKIYSFLKKAHVILFPSKGENFSVALLEALNIQKIVICSDIPSFKEVIIPSKNGFIASDMHKYLEILKSIFNNEVDIETISIEAKKTVLNNFNNSKLINLNIDYYLSIYKK